VRTVRTPESRGSGLTKGIMNKFDQLNDTIRDTESSVVNLLSAIAPWFAPLAPAYMTFQHAVGVLSFPLWIAWPIAIVVEIMGFSALSTFMEFWFFNRRNPAGYKKAPIETVVIAFAVYLITIISSNVLLDAFDNSKPIVITVRAMLAIQTVPAAIIVIVRAGHRELLKEIKKSKEAEQLARNQAKAEKQAAKEAEKLAQVAQAEATLPKAPARKPVSDTDLLAFLQANPGASQQQVADNFHVSRQAIGQRVKKLYEVKQ
jgi:hypothetical protein